MIVDAYYSVSQNNSLQVASGNRDAEPTFTFIIESGNKYLTCTFSELKRDYRFINHHIFHKCFNLYDVKDNFYNPENLKISEITFYDVFYYDLILYDIHWSKRINDQNWLIHNIRETEPSEKIKWMDCFGNKGFLLFIKEIPDEYYEMKKYSMNRRTRDQYKDWCRYKENLSDFRDPYSSLGYL